MEVFRGIINALRITSHIALWVAVIYLLAEF